MNSVLRYYGGKGGMKKEIVSHFPDKSTFNLYGEFFGGGASVLFEKEPSEIEIYNDLEQNVYSLFRVLSDPTLFITFKTLADLSYFSRQLRDEYIKDLKEKHDELTLVQRAFRFWYVNRTSYNGNGGFSVNMSIRRKMSKSTSDFLSTVENLDNIHQRLSSVAIENKDALELIKKYDIPNAFFYLDSPYHFSKRTEARYTVDMDNEKQKEYIDILLNLKHAKALVSGYNCEEYDRLCQNGWGRVDFEHNTVDTKHNAKTEIESIWRNY